MAFRLSPQAQKRVDEARWWAEERRRQMTLLSNENLVSTAKMYMAQMTPMRFAPGEPVYDATMWHIILPELLRRLDNGN